MMRLLGIVATYLGATGLLFGGLIGGVFWLVKPDPTAATVAPRVAPISPRIAESIERKKLDTPAPTPVVQTTSTTIEPQPITPVMQEAPAALTQAPHRVQIRELSQRTAKRKPLPHQRNAAAQNVATQEAAATPAPSAARPIATARSDSPY
ncbi:MAG: hypothetical protein E6G97_07095 [Alphaproteobacteria bacterium]|nr:MAG: hypothetical protein E6G97_07095 [Alphaproteobacteria bacterium]